VRDILSRLFFFFRHIEAFNSSFSVRGQYRENTQSSSYSPSTSIPERSFLHNNPTDRRSPPVFADPFRRSSVTTTQSNNIQKSNRVIGGEGMQSTLNWTTFFDFQRNDNDNFESRKSSEPDSRGSGGSGWSTGPLDESGSPSRAGFSIESVMRTAVGGTPGSIQAPIPTPTPYSGSPSPVPSTRPALTRYRTSPASFQHRGLEITIGTQDLIVPSSSSRSGLDDDGGGGGDDGMREQIGALDDFGRRLSIVSTGSLLGMREDRRHEGKKVNMSPLGDDGDVRVPTCPRKEKDGGVAPGSPTTQTSRQGSWASISVSIEDRPFDVRFPVSDVSRDDAGGRKRFDSVDGGKARVERSGIWGLSRVGREGRGSLSSEKDVRGSHGGVPLDGGGRDEGGGGKEWYERRGSWAEL
jgi:hypothetical protein